MRNACIKQIEDFYLWICKPSLQWKFKYDSNPLEEMYANFCKALHPIVSEIRFSASRYTKCYRALNCYIAPNVLIKFTTGRNISTEICKVCTWINSCLLAESLFEKTRLWIYSKNLQFMRFSNLCSLIYPEVIFLYLYLLIKADFFFPKNTHYLNKESNYEILKIPAPTPKSITYAN